MGRIPTNPGSCFLQLITQSGEILINNICMFSSQTFKAFKLCIDCEIQTNTSSSFCHGVFLKFEYLWLKSLGIPVLLQFLSSLITLGHWAPYLVGRVLLVLPALEGRRQARLRSYVLEMVSFATQMLIPAFALFAMNLFPCLFGP